MNVVVQLQDKVEWDELVRKMRPTSPNKISGPLPDTGLKFCAILVLICCKQDVPNTYAVRDLSTILPNKCPAVFQMADLCLQKMSLHNIQWNENSVDRR